MIKPLAVALLAASATSAMANMKCEDLARMGYSARWGIDTPVSEVVRDVLHNTGWKLDLRVTGREPVIRGNLSGVSARVLDSVVAKLAASGVQTNFRYYPGECRVAIAIHNPNSVNSTVAQTGVGAPGSQVAGSAEAERGRWVLRAGRPLHRELAEWAKQAGWSFSWRPERSWLVPADATFDGTFEDAIAAVIESLFDQGKPVRLVLWQGNQFAEVIDVNAHSR